MEVRKLKAQYRKRNTKYWIDEFWDERYYPSLRGDWYRSFSTKQERSSAMLHEIEFKEFGIKVRPSRAANLVDSWDDIPCSARWSRKSWKHHSKRKHQYFRISEK